MPVNRWGGGDRQHHIQHLAVFSTDRIFNVIMNFLKMHVGMFRQIGAMAKRNPICVSLSVGTYFTVIVRYLTLFYHTPEMSYTPI